MRKFVSGRVYQSFGKFENFDDVQAFRSVFDEFDIRTLYSIGPYLCKILGRFDIAKLRFFFCKAVQVFTQSSIVNTNYRITETSNIH